MINFINMNTMTANVNRRVFQEKLVAAWTGYVQGTVDAAALKSVSSGFGIYQQRDGMTMMRIRRVGGLLTTGDMRQVAAILRRHGGAFAHLTTRQDIQMHGIPAAAVPAALEDCESVGFRFRGGGGDTFRNTLVSPYSGLHPDSVFDVVPYAQALSNAFYGFDLAYGLPRKLKIAFADRPADAYLAETNDLGFVAKVVDGQRVFETYIGGGIGFRPRLGFKLFEALPAEDCIRVAMALTALFNDKGCRTKRAHARIRFLREDLGDAEFERLIHEYMAKLPAETPKAVVSSDNRLVETHFPAVSPSADFATWKDLAVTPLAQGRVAVRLFVPFGDFTPAELETFADAMEPFGATRFEILPTLDLGLVVAASQLPGLYAMLRAMDRDYVAASFVGNIRTCIGCRVCKGGITEAPSIGRRIADYFDAKYRPLDTPEKTAVARALLNDVRISGCPNSCTCHPLAKFGFAGRKLDGADAETAYLPGSVDPVVLGDKDPSAPPIPAAAFPAFLEDRILTELRK